MLMKRISKAVLKMCPWYYVTYITLSLQLYPLGAKMEQYIQLPTNVYVGDPESYNSTPNFEQLIGKTIMDVQYQFQCHARRRQTKQPDTEDRVSNMLIDGRKKRRVNIHLVSTCNYTDDSKTKIVDALLPADMRMDTDHCLGAMLSSHECINATATVPVEYSGLWERFAALFWNNGDLKITDIAFVTVISPESFGNKRTVALPEPTTDLRITASDPSLRSIKGLEWQFSTSNIIYETRKQCSSKCPEDLEPDGRVIYFNGTSLDMTSPRIFGSYWRCALNVKFYLRNEEIALILNVIQGNRVWTHRYRTTDTWTEHGVPIGQINGIFNVQIQMFRTQQVSWKIGKLQNAVFENCGLSEEHSDKPKPGLINDTFVCKTGVLITSDQLCDLHNDCFHGDDESDEICGNGFSLGLYDFEANINYSLILSDYGKSTSTVMGANITAALTDANGSLKGHILAFEEQQYPKKAGFVTVNLTKPESYLASNKSCVVDTYRSDGGRFRGRSRGDFNLIVKVIDADTEDTLKRDETILKLNEWQKYRLLIPDFSERNVTTFYLVVFTALSIRNFLGFDNFFISYECMAKDPPETSPREIPKESSLVMIVALSCTSLAIVWISILLIIYMRYTKMPKTGKSGKRLSLFGARRRSLKCVPYSAPLLRRLNDNLWQEHPNYLMYKQILTQDLSDDIKNLSRYKLKLTKVLGSGAFGEVLQGQLIKGAICKHVAVKRLSSGCSEKERTDFLVEALTMSKFKHANIVCCLGIYVKNGALLLVEELMAGGDLKQFLVESRPTIDETPALSTDELLSLANDICQACSYLEAHKFIHRDIASRNCLLTTKTPDRVAKMADFGLARDIIQNDSYKKCGRSMLPVRWLPPESYLEGVFTTKSDVWAYGILLWEIFSFGYDPYPSMKCEEMMAKVNGGQRMTAPSRCPTVVYDVMMLCWQHDPKSRPSFERLCEYLQKIRKNVCIDIVSNNNVSDDEREDVNSDDESKLHAWHYNGNYAVEEESV